MGICIGYRFHHHLYSWNKLILRLLTSEQNIVQNAQPFLVWVIIIPFATFGSFIWDGIYIGATASRAMRDTLIASTILIFAPIYYFLQPLWGNHALWLAMLLFMFSRGVIQTLLYKKAVIKPLSKQNCD